MTFQFSALDILIGLLWLHVIAAYTIVFVSGLERNYGRVFGYLVYGSVILFLLLVR